jgi:hypothetical protein
MAEASREWPLQPAGRIALLDVDPDLGGGDAGREIDPASRVNVQVYRISAGPMPEPPSRAGQPPHLGFLLLKGLLLYEVSVCGRATAELLGPGDLVRPWPRQESGMLGSLATWTVLEQVLLADLAPLATGQGSTHEIVAALLARGAERAEMVAVQRSIAAHVRVDVRVLAYLWHLADRFGVVLPGAVRLNLPLTHAVLARLVGARRPTVTTALQRLMQLGYLRREKRAFVLVGDAGAIEELERRSPVRDFALPEPNGHAAALRSR